MGALVHLQARLWSYIEDVENCSSGSAILHEATGRRDLSGRNAAVGKSIGVKLQCNDLFPVIGVKARDKARSGAMADFPPPPSYFYNFIMYSFFLLLYELSQAKLKTKVKEKPRPWTKLRLKQK